MGAGFTVQVFFQGSAFRLQGSGFRIQGLRLYQTVKVKFWQEKILQVLK